MKQRAQRAEALLRDEGVDSLMAADFVEMRFRESAAVASELVESREHRHFLVLGLSNEKTRLVLPSSLNAIQVETNEYSSGCPRAHNSVVLSGSVDAVLELSLPKWVTLISWGFLSFGAVLD